MNSRKFPRLDLGFVAEYTSGNRRFRHRAGNVSGGGLFIHSPLNLLSGTELTLSFRPSRRSPVLRARGRVRFTIPGLGFGVEFVKISQAARNALLHLVHRRTIGRRKQPRVPLVAQVEYGKKQPLGWVKDIGPGGLFIEADRVPEAGSEVLVRFNLPTRGDVTEARCVVVYRLGTTGMGMHFVEISQDDIEGIKSYVEKLFPRESQKAKKQDQTSIPLSPGE